MSHLLAVHRHNLKHDLTEHVNSQRAGFALGSDGGLVICTWPQGDEPALPLNFCDEIWPGIEYQVASHLMSVGCVSEGLEIVRVLRARYDGTVRNPYNEYECGHWNARAMASYALLYGLSGVSYDAVDRVLTVAPPVPGDFRVFLCTAGGYGTAGVQDGEPFLDVCFGSIPTARIVYVPCQSGGS